jgi:hypothetical protein
MRPDDAERAIVESPRRDCIFAIGHAGDRPMPASSAAIDICAQASSALFELFSGDITDCGGRGWRSRLFGGRGGNDAVHCRNSVTVCGWVAGAQ